MHKQVHPKSLYWGNTVILLSTIDDTDTTNITPISSSWSLSNNIVIGLSLNSKAIETGLTHQCLYFEQPHTFEQILFIQTAEPALVGHA